jgi:dehydrogenase/reductase SDR family protein 7B
MNLNDKVIWITGASSGIGEALVKESYDAGAKIILSARNEEKLKKISQNLEDYRFLVLPLDLEDHNGLVKKAEIALNHWGYIDILINNGGISQRSLLHETEYSVMKKIIDVNFLGTATLCRLVIPSMIKRGQGSLVAVSSVAGKFSTPFRSIYSASKMALQGLCDGLRAELWEDGIKVSLVVPGYVKTDISKNAFSADGKKHGKMDPNQEAGISADKAAKKIISGIKKEKREIFIGLVAKTRVALFLARFFPGILAKILRNAKVT